MADNTVLNPGVGGDTLKTEDCGTGFKIPAGFHEIERRRYDDTEVTFLRLA